MLEEKGRKISEKNREGKGRKEVFGAGEGRGEVSYVIFPNKPNYDC